MPVFGRSHHALMAAAGFVIAALFVAVAVLTRASRRQVGWALVGAVAAGAANVGLDVVAHSAGWWRCPEATTPFGPLVYYAEAGLGFGALALLFWDFEQRFGWKTPVALAAVISIYGPVRDHWTAGAFHLIEFRPGGGIFIVDALFEWVVPLLVAISIARLERVRR